LAGRFRKVADLPRIGDHHRELGRGDGSGRRHFEPTGRLQDHEGGRPVAQLPEQRPDALVGVRKARDDL